MIVYLDLDGVLAKFVESASLAITGRIVDQTTLTSYYKLPHALNLTTDQFWQQISKIGYDFWADIEPFPWTYDLVQQIERLPVEVYICTSPTLSPDCPKGKIIWLQRHLPHMIRESALVFTRQKHLLAHNKAILIDDHDKNISRFQEGGGHGITFPQPWNEHRRMPDPDTIIEWTLNEIKERMNASLSQATRPSRYSTQCKCQTKSG